MGEREDRPRAVGVVADRRDDGRRRARLGARDELLAREAALEQQAVQVRVLEREGAVGGAELGSVAARSKRSAASRKASEISAASSACLPRRCL